MQKVIYFNQWFSSIFNVIADLKLKFGNEIKVIASSRNENHVYKATVDEFITENWEYGETEEEKEDNYMRFVLDLCSSNSVNIFFAKANSAIIAKHINEFRNRGIKVVIESANTIELVENKVATYRYMERIYDLAGLVPRYFTSLGLEEEFARKEIKSIIKNTGYLGTPLWCLKLNCDEGAQSFRVIEKEPDFTIRGLRVPRFNRLTKKDAKKLVKNCSKEELDRIIFMEMLDSPEISVDCYKSKKGFISICRMKTEGRTEQIYFDKELNDICEKIQDYFGIKHPFNVQFRVRNKGDIKCKEDIRLLEINARMSGGVYYEVVCGLNICEIVLKDLLDRDDYDIETFRNFEDITMTHVETAMII